jgi:hypothetical protein
MRRVNEIMDAAFKEREQRYKLRYLCRDSLMLSYPKCGRTWVRMILAKLLVNMGYSNQDKEAILAMHQDPDNILERFTSDVKIIFLYRNIGDVAMSFWWETFFSDRLNMGVRGGPSRFLKHDPHGLRGISRFYNIWFDALSHGRFKHHMFLRYEDLHADTFSEMKRVVDFLGITHMTGPNQEDLGPSLIYKYLEDAIEYSKFENMKRIEKQNNEQNLLKHYKGNFGNLGIKNASSRMLQEFKAEPDLVAYLKSRNLEKYIAMNSRWEDDPGRLRRGEINGYLRDLDKEDIDFIKKVESLIRWPDKK